MGKDQPRRGEGMEGRGDRWSAPLPAGGEAGPPLWSRPRRLAVTAGRVRGPGHGPNARPELEVEALDEPSR